MNKLHLFISAGLLTCSSLALAADEHKHDNRMLETLDTNGDDVVNLMEFQSGENNMLARMDTDGNGVLTIDEFLNARPGPGMGGMGRRGGDRDDANRPEPSEDQLAHMAEMQARMTERATARFQAMDVNGDDIVTLNEFQTANFTEMDRNDDGVLDAEELRPPRMGRPGPGGQGQGHGKEHGQSQSHGDGHNQGQGPRGDRPARN